MEPNDRLSSLPALLDANIPNPLPPYLAS